MRLTNFGWTSDPTARNLGDPQNLGNDLVDWGRGFDLMVTESAEPGLDHLNVSKHARQFPRMLAEGVVRPRRQTLEKRVDRSAQKDDLVELRQELDHVLLTSRQKQNRPILQAQQVLDGLLPPTLGAVSQRLRQTVVSVDRLVAMFGESARYGRLAGSRHSGKENTAHMRIVVVVCI